MNATPAQEALIAVIVLVAIVAVARFEVFCLRELTRARDADLLYLTRRPGSPQSS